jgi:serine/threonine-protein kinase
MRVVIAEDNALLRAGLVELLRRDQIEVVGEVSDARTLADLVRETKPDVVVVDVRMPPTHTTEGLAAAHAVRREHGTAIGILVLSHHVEARYALDLIADGAHGIGYLLKDRVLGPAELIDALRRVALGGSALDPLVVEHLLKRRRDDVRLTALTPREHEVLSLLAEGRSNRSVAASLFITEKTVEAATGRIFAKLDLVDSPDSHRRVQAVLAWLHSSAEPAHLPSPPMPGAGGQGVNDEGPITRQRPGARTP